LVDATRLDAVLMLGVKFRSPWLSLERVGLNVLHASIPDVDGERIEHAAVSPDGPRAIFAGGDTVALAKHLQGLGVEARPSYHAGTYVCNQAYYIASHAFEGHAESPPVLFVHIPRLPEQAPDAEQAHTRSYDQIVEGVGHIGAYMAEGRLFIGGQSS
jgi:pyroglutamyl-peptidase